MSTIKFGSVQIGTSQTASNNFHWRNLLDGLLRLSRGNAGSPITDVMRVKADNSVEFPGGVASGVFGAGQTPQDVTPSRAANTTYQNTTGKGIFVSVQAAMSAQGAYPVIIVDGVNHHGNGAYAVGAVCFVCAPVPAGSSYSLGALGGTIQTITKWLELR